MVDDARGLWRTFGAKNSVRYGSVSGIIEMNCHAVRCSTSRERFIRREKLWDGSRFPDPYVSPKNA